MANMTLQEVEDRAAIYDVHMRYAQAVDQYDYAGVAACFTPDAKAEYSGKVLAPGPQGIVDYIKGRGRPALKMHVIGTQLIDWQGEKANVETYCVAHLVNERDGKKQMTMRAVRFMDRMVKRNGSWLISERVHSIDWTTDEALNFAELSGK